MLKVMCAICLTGLTTTPLQYQGGSVQTSPHIYVDYWGSQWKKDRTTRHEVSRFFENVGGSQWASQLSEYKAKTPKHELKGQWIDITPLPRVVTQQAIAHEAFRALQHFHNYLFNTTIVVMTPKHHNINEPWCGYHDFISGSGYRDGLPYMYVAYDSPRCFSRTVILSHEYAEVVTDPLFTGWFDNSGKEIADKCKTAITFARFGIHQLLVQKIWSNKQNACRVV